MHPITDPDMAAAALELHRLCAQLTADLLELAATLPAPAYPPETGLRNHQDACASS